MCRFVRSFVRSLGGFTPGEMFLFLGNMSLHTITPCRAHFWTCSQFEAKYWSPWCKNERSHRELKGFKGDTIGLCETWTRDPPTELTYLRFQLRSCFVMRTLPTPSFWYVELSCCCVSRALESFINIPTECTLIQIHSLYSTASPHIYFSLLLCLNLSSPS